MLHKVSLPKFTTKIYYLKKTAQGKECHPQNDIKTCLPFLYSNLNSMMHDIFFDALII